MREFIDCEYIDKIKFFVTRTDTISQGEGKYSEYDLKYSFKAFLTSLVSQDKKYKQMWRDRLNSLTSHIFDFKKLDLQLPKQMSAQVQVVFLFRKDQGFSFKQCSDIFSFMDKECLSKISQMNSASTIELVKLENKLNKLNLYFQSYSDETLILSNFINKIEAEKPDLGTIVAQYQSEEIQSFIKSEIEKLFNGKTLVF